jgi:hypothetical protein
VTGDLSVNTNKFAVNATTGALTGPNTGSFAIDNGNGSSIDIGGTTATTLNLGRSGQTQALLGNGTVAGTLNVAGNFSVATNKLVINSVTGAITGPNTGAFTIDNGNASAMNIGGATATTLNLGRSGQTQALLGNVTVAGTLNGATGGAFSIDNNTAAAINIGGTTATTLNLGRSGQTQALLGNATVAGTLGVTGATTLSSTLGVTGAGTFSSTLGVTGNLTVGASTFTVTAATGNTAIAGALDVTGPVTAGGGIQIGGTGTTITQHLSATFAYNPGTVTNARCANSGGQTVTGAAVGDTVVVSVNGALPTGFILTGYVSAANTVIVRWCNLSGGNSDPGVSQTYRVDVWQH